MPIKLVSARAEPASKAKRATLETLNEYMAAGRAAQRITERL